MNQDSVKKLFMQIDMAVDLHAKMQRAPLSHAQLCVDRDGWVASVEVIRRRGRKGRPFRIHGTLSATPALAAESLITSLDVWAEVL